MLLQGPSRSRATWPRATLPPRLASPSRLGSRPCEVCSGFLESPEHGSSLVKWSCKPPSLAPPDLEPPGPRLSRAPSPPACLAHAHSHLHLHLHTYAHAHPLHSARTPEGFIKVDPKFRVEGAESRNIFAIGDCCNVAQMKLRVTTATSTTRHGPLIHFSCLLDPPRIALKFVISSSSAEAESTY